MCGPVLRLDVLEKCIIEKCYTANFFSWGVVYGSVVCTPPTRRSVYTYQCGSSTRTRGPDHHRFHISTYCTCIDHHDSPPIKLLDFEFGVLYSLYRELL